jgi:5-methylcytosine-specific restriction endonuclease McrA
MRAVYLPNFDVREVYQSCIKSIKNEELKDRLNQATNDIIMAANDYQQKAKTEQLYTIHPNNCNPEEIALGSVTKGELIDVYSSQMVKNKNARPIYDKLLSLAPLGLCPFCGLGHASTLDHYLPKTKYPQLSVLPLNLVPSCKDCNTGKNAENALKVEEQCLHPYFDHQNFIADQWLYAKLKQTEPITIDFFVKPPNDWSNISKARVQAHFKNFKLDLRYAVAASNELAFLKDSFTNFGGSLGRNGVKDLLTSTAQSHARLHRNSWQTAMYQALTSSDWYCDGGFL